ncbi:hypothetical protein NKG94_38090 [Micromonospora sp. M12]
MDAVADGAAGRGADPDVPGMHHPSDVVASFLNGGTCVAIMARAVLDRGLRWGRAKLPTVGRPVAPARS